MIKSIVLASSLFALAACATTASAPEPEKVPEIVAVEVATGCVASSGRPAEPDALSIAYPEAEWSKLAPGAKAEAIRAQAGKRLNYEDQDRAATSGCR